MIRTPGFIAPSPGASKEETEKNLRRLSAAAGFSPFDPSEFDEDVIEHFGTKGMKWGVRKSDIPGVSRGTSRDAAKDAKEFARAKMFYGEGAGNRRKLIKGTVEGKSKKDPGYKKAFDHHLNNQDMSKHSLKARSERKRKNVQNTTAKTARGVSHMVRGNTRYASALAAGVFGAGVALHKSGVDKVILNAGKKAYRDLAGKNTIRAGMSASDFLKNMGML